MTFYTMIVLAVTLHKMMEMSDVHSNESQGKLQEKPPLTQEESLEENNFSLLVTDTKTVHNFDKKLESCIKKD